LFIIGLQIRSFILGEKQPAEDFDRRKDFDASVDRSAKT
jgi:hypothetical protein